MLLSMRAGTEATRALAYYAAGMIDRARSDPDGDARARAQRRVDLLIPVVKAWSTDTRARSVLDQHPGAWRDGLHRGDRRGAASARRAHRPHLRRHQRHPGQRPRRPQARARLRAPRSRELVADMRATAHRTRRRAGCGGGCPARAARRRLRRAGGRERPAAGPISAPIRRGRSPASVPYLRLMGIVTGGWLMAKSALAADRLLGRGQRRGIPARRRSPPRTSMPSTSSRRRRRFLPRLPAARP